MTDPRDNKAWLDALRPPIDEDALGDLRAIILRGLRAALSSRIDSDLNAVTEDFPPLSVGSPSYGVLCGLVN